MVFGRGVPRAARRFRLGHDVWDAGFDKRLCADRLRHPGLVLAHGRGHIDQAAASPQVQGLTDVVSAGTLTLSDTTKTSRARSNRGGIGYVSSRHR